MFILSQRVQAHLIFFKVRLDKMKSLEASMRSFSPQNMSLPWPALNVWCACTWQLVLIWQITVEMWSMFSRESCGRPTWTIRVNMDCWWFKLISYIWHQLCYSSKYGKKIFLILSVFFNFAKFFWEDQHPPHNTCFSSNVYYYDTAAVVPEWCIKGPWSHFGLKMLLLYLIHWHTVVLLLYFATRICRLVIFLHFDGAAQSNMVLLVKNKFCDFHFHYSDLFPPVTSKRKAVFS